MKTAEQIGRDLAYPLTEHHGDGSYFTDHAGMTMRQYYKAAAMRGIVGNARLVENLSSATISDATKWISTYAGRFADAMLTEDAEFEAKRAAQ